MDSEKSSFVLNGETHVVASFSFSSPFLFLFSFLFFPSLPFLFKMENADRSGRKLRFNSCWKAVECLTDNGLRCARTVFLLIVRR